MFHRQNQDIFNSKCVPAIERYTGFVYDHINWPSLSKKSQSYMIKHVITNMINNMIKNMVKHIVKNMIKHIVKNMVLNMVKNIVKTPQ